MAAHFTIPPAMPGRAVSLPPSVLPSDNEPRRAALLAAVRLFEQGEARAALGQLEALLAAHPDWVEGHMVMAQLLSQSGEPHAFCDFLSWTVRRARGDLTLVVACLRQLSDAEQHGCIARLVPEVRRWAGENLFFTLLEAVAASELGDLARADTLFASATQAGGVLSLPYVRHLIRTGDPVKAATVAQAFVADQPGHQGAWALLETAWRLIGDTRHAWLVDQPGLIDTIDVALSHNALEALAACLRRFHEGRSHPFDQSLRGGPQTAGRLFRHQDIEIREVRRALTAAVRRYLDALPPADPRHPLLGQDRTAFHISDSWSVRLLDGGFHVSHIHPQAMISSTFYVTLPPLGTDERRAGWFTIGEPPESLRTGLPPLHLIEPKVGHLALFPSFLWHGIPPFPEGERMTMAFDTVLGGQEAYQGAWTN